MPVKKHFAHSLRLTLSSRNCGRIRSLMLMEVEEAVETRYRSSLRPFPDKVQTDMDRMKAGRDWDTHRKQEEEHTG